MKLRIFRHLVGLLEVFDKPLLCIIFSSSGETLMWPAKTRRPFYVVVVPEMLLVALHACVCLTVSSRDLGSRPFCKSSEKSTLEGNILFRPVLKICPEVNHWFKFVSLRAIRMKVNEYSS